MKRLSSISVLCCAFASAALIHAALLRQDAIAEPSGAARTQIAQAPTEAKRSDNGWEAEITQPAKAKPGDHGAQGIDETLYPTAAQCGECHKQIYDEWSSSQHAYASISPMFHKFEQKFQDLTQGTVGTFCVRCHQQVGTQLGEARESPLWGRS